MRLSEAWVQNSWVWAYFRIVPVLWSGFQMPFLNEDYFSFYSLSACLLHCFGFSECMVLVSFPVMGCCSRCSLRWKLERVVHHGGGSQGSGSIEAAGIVFCSQSREQWMRVQPAASPEQCRSPCWGSDPSSSYLAQTREALTEGSEAHVPDDSTVCQVDNTNHHIYKLTPFFSCPS